MNVIEFDTFSHAKNSYPISIYQCNFSLWFSRKDTWLMLLWVLFWQGLHKIPLKMRRKKESLENKWLLFKAKSIETDNYCIMWDMECHDYFWIYAFQLFRFAYRRGFWEIFYLNWNDRFISRKSNFQHITKNQEICKKNTEWTNKRNLKIFDE